MIPRVVREGWVGGKQAETVRVKVDFEESPIGDRNKK